MGKVYLFVGIACVLMVLLSLSGINTATGYVLNVLGVIDTDADYNSIPIYASVIAALALLGVAGAGIRIGLFGSDTSQYIGGVAMAGVLALFIGDFIGVITSLRATCPSGSDCAWLSTLTVPFLGIFIIFFVIALFDYARGTDN